MPSLTKSRFKAQEQFCAQIQSGYRMHFNSDHSLFVTDWDASCLELTGYSRKELSDPHLEARLFGLARETWLRAVDACFAAKQAVVFSHNLQGKTRVVRVEHRLQYVDPASLTADLRQVAVLSSNTSAKKERAKPEREVWAMPVLFADQPALVEQAPGWREIYTQVRADLFSKPADLEQTLPKAAKALGATLNPGQVRIVLAEDGLLREKVVYNPVFDKQQPGAGLELDLTGLAALFSGQQAQSGHLCLSTSTCPGYQAAGTAVYEQALACPIQAHGRLCGFLSAEDNQRRWTQEEGFFAALLADLCGLLLVCSQFEQERQGLLGLLSGFPGMAAFIRLEGEKLPLDFVSEGCLGLTGYDQGHFLSADGFDLMELIDPEDAALVLDYFKNSGQVLASSVCFKIKRKDGQIARICASFKPLRHADSRRHFQGFCMDQTEFYSLLAKEESNQAKSDFLATISHELRTPLNAICGLAHLALLTKLDKRQRDYLEKISGAASSLMNVINDVLTFSKAKNGHNRLERIDFSPAALVEELAGLFAAPLRERGIELQLCLSPDLPALVQGDEDKVLVILENLLDNVRKYALQGAVDLVCQVDRRESEYCRLLFMVSDSGPGIPENQQHKVFDAFVQASAYQTRKYGGMGLGLSISKQLAEIMGGELHLRSEDGVGTCVSFACPFSLPRIFVNTPTACVMQSEARPCFAGQKVLLVEDNELNQMIALELLESANLSVMLAENGQQALNLARQNLFDLILMDLQMPVMDGIQAAMEIRKLREHGTMPILALTAHAFEQEKQRCFQAGMDGMLSKPIEPCLLYETIARHLRADAVSR